MKVLIVIDVQNGFMTRDNYLSLKDRINNYIINSNYDRIIFTKFINDKSKNPLYVDSIGWEKLTTKEEQDFSIDIPKNAIIFEKFGYALKQEDLEYIKSLNIESIDICGLKANACVYAIALQLFDLGIKPNILINNSGYIFEGSVLGCNMEELCTCIDVNIKATTELTYWFLTNREKSVKNYCLFVSSLGGYYPMPQMATYSASKSYLTNFAIALRYEMKKKNVNITCIAPGGMATSSAMQNSLKSQGLGGKLSAQAPEKVARIGIKKMLKNKPLWIPGLFNKLTVFTSLFTTKQVIASFVGKRWEKCEKKRGDYR